MRKNNCINEENFEEMYQTKEESETRMDLSVREDLETFIYMSTVTCQQFMSTVHGNNSLIKIKLYKFNVFFEILGNTFTYLIMVLWQSLYQFGY